MTPAQRHVLYATKDVVSLLDCWDDLSAAYEDAMQGDGAWLASRIEHCWQVVSVSPRTTLAMVPYVTSNREALRMAIRGFHTRHDWGWSSRDSQLDMIYKAAVQRDLMRVSGNTDLATTWQTIMMTREPNGYDAIAAASSSAPTTHSLVAPRSPARGRNDALRMTLNRN